MSILLPSHESLDVLVCSTVGEGQACVSPSANQRAAFFHSAIGEEEGEEEEKDEEEEEERKKEIRSSVEEGGGETEKKRVKLPPSAVMGRCRTVRKASILLRELFV